MYSNTPHTGKTATWTFSNIQGVNSCDTDGDGIPNTCDLDSDGDGCSDTVETGNLPLNQNNIATYSSGPVNALGCLQDFLQLLQRIVE